MCGCKDKCKDKCAPKKKCGCGCKSDSLRSSVDRFDYGPLRSERFDYGDRFDVGLRDYDSFERSSCCRDYRSCCETRFSSDRLLLDTLLYDAPYYKGYNNGWWNPYPYPYALYGYPWLRFP
jgi:hypothetical protein